MLPDLHGFGPQLLFGAAMTVGVAAASVVLGSLIGLAVAVAKLAKMSLLQAAAGAYTTVIRGVPDLLVIFVIYYGGTVTLSSLIGRHVEVDPFSAGVVALSVVFGAYAAEIFRGGILGVPRGQSDAARALGLSPRAAFVSVILPQAWRLALPAFGSQTLILVKQTSLVSIVGLEELMRKAAIAVGATHEPFTFYVAAGALYLVLTGMITLGLRGLELRAARGYGHA
ncbi:MAG: ABC transporter permease subunit [Clostridia bacterium]|nr:ABC transporter permease subunit [Deltaproteobacteria bacterium]